MDFNKCVRCGSFFIANSTVCCNCEPKDRLDMAHSDSFISGNPEITTV